MSILFKILIGYTMVRHFPVYVILGIVFMLIFLKIIDWAIPDYMVENYGGCETYSSGTAVKVTKKTKVITVSPKTVKTKTCVVKNAKPVSSHKQKMDRFEEEAFWINVFDDDEF